MVFISKPPVRIFNGIRFFTADETTASRLFGNMEMERGYAYGREITAGSTPPDKILHRRTASRKVNKAKGKLSEHSKTQRT